jgi:hypothetical protein
LASPPSNQLLEGVEPSKHDNAYEDRANYDEDIDGRGRSIHRRLNRSKTVLNLPKRRNQKK